MKSTGSRGDLTVCSHLAVSGGVGPGPGQPGLDVGREAARHLAPLAKVGRDHPARAKLHPCLARHAAHGHPAASPRARAQKPSSDISSPRPVGLRPAASIRAPIRVTPLRRDRSIAIIRSLVCTDWIMDSRW